jgi:E3 ubiquitin-protein ligase UBR7
LLFLPLHGQASKTFSKMSGKDDATTTNNSNTIVTMAEVLAAEEDGSVSDIGLLMGGDPSRCTYPDGPLSQPLFTCLACNERDGGKPRGLCFGCSVECHSDHAEAIVELYWKRDYQCECGAGDGCGPCSFGEGRRERREANRVTQNFSSRFCICEQPYDPAGSDPMYQCVGPCEDWYHHSCVDKFSRIPPSIIPDHGKEEFMCLECYMAAPPLWRYEDLLVSGGSEAARQRRQQLQPPAAATAPIGGSEHTVLLSPPLAGRKRDAEGNIKEANTEEPAQGSSCTAPPARADPGFARADLPCASNRPEATFWQPGWRSKLCQCPGCVEALQAKGLGYFLDPKAFLHLALEDDDDDDDEDGDGNGNADGDEDGDQTRGRRGSACLYDEAERAFESHLTVTQQRDLSHGFNELKDQLRDYLAVFAREGRVVSDKDIKDFFANMKRK